jgi:hypothetical protein
MRRPAPGTMRLLIAVVFVAASLVALRAPAQTATPAAAQIPAAPAGGINPSKLPDIQGIHLGMSPQDLLPALNVLYPPGKVLLPLE